jgi:hypothetical protein
MITKRHKKYGSQIVVQHAFAASLAFFGNDPSLSTSITGTFAGIEYQNTTSFEIRAS